MIDVYDRPIMSHRLFSLLLAVFVAACAVPAERDEGVVIAQNVRLRLAAIAPLGQAIEAVQMVSAQHGDDSFTFEGRLSVRADGLTLAIFDGLGRRAMTVRWEQGDLKAEKAPWLPDSMPPPANMLADIMLIYWPQPALSTALDGAVIVDVEGWRRLRRDGAEVVAIHRDPDPWNGHAELHNLAWNYRIAVQSRQLAP